MQHDEGFGSGAAESSDNNNPATENNTQLEAEEEEEEEEEELEVGPNAYISLLDQHSELKKKAEARKETAREKLLKEEQKILESVAESKGIICYKKHIVLDSC